MDFTTSAETAVKLPAGAKIVLAEGTTNTIASAADNADMSYGIYAAGNLTIEGSGTLIVRSAKATPSSDDGESYGIYANNGDITISGGTIEATGGKSYATDYSSGISGRNVIISGGVVTAKGGQESGGNYGIYADGGLVEISGGVVTATGNTADFGSYGIYAISVVISGGFITATGDTAEEYCYGIYASSKGIPISGGHVIARTLASKSAENQAALVTPDLSAYTGYYWRTSSGTSFTQTAYTYSETHTYVEFSSQNTVTTYTVTFNVNGGSGEMTAVTGVSDSYTLPDCTFTAPEGKQFKGWATSADGEVISGTSITVTADTTMYAIWESIPAVTTYTVTFNANDGELTEGSKTFIKTEADGTVVYLPRATREGDTVTLAAGSIINFIFSGWTSDDVIISDVYSADTSFVMPEKDVTVTANWIYNGIIIIPGGGSSGDSTTPTYPPIVEQPTEGGSVDTSTDKPIAGDNVIITPTPDEGYDVDEVIVTDQNGNPVEITDNGDSTTFSPDEPCTRAQVVTFLWRAAGCPPPNSTEMPFTDVVEGSYYETAVLWAVENGITLGTNAEGTLFSPDAVCSRAQIVTFLYRCLSNK